CPRSAVPPLVLVPAPAPAPTYPLSLHDALPLSRSPPPARPEPASRCSAPSAVLTEHRLVDLAQGLAVARSTSRCSVSTADGAERSEEHTSELQSLAYLGCRLLLGKKKAATRDRH